MGGGGSKTIVKPNPPTANELELQKLSVEISQQQLEEIKRQSALQMQQQDLANAFLGLGLDPVSAAFGGPQAPSVGAAFTPDPNPELQSQLGRLDLQERDAREELRLAADPGFEMVAQRRLGQIAEERRQVESKIQQQQQSQQAQFEQEQAQAQQQAQAQLPPGEVPPALQRAREIGELTRQRELETFERESSLQSLQEQLLQKELEAIERGPGATPEQQQLISQITEQALASGESDINRFREQGLEQLRSTLAPSLGLRPGDSPILDRGARVAEEATRQQGQLTSSLRGAEAQSLLNFPLAAGQLQSGRAQAQQSIGQASQAFQAQLRQQITANRLAQQGTQASSGLGLAGLPFAGGGALSALGANRGSATTKSGGGGLGQVASIAGGVGGLFSGLGAVGAAGGFAALSSRKLKDNIRRLDTDKILKKVSDLEVANWRYVGDEQDHLGPFAEDFKEAFGVGDGVTINLLDAVGVLMGSVQALNRKIEVLENGERTESVQ